MALCTGRGFLSCGIPRTRPLLWSQRQGGAVSPTLRPNLRKMEMASASLNEGGQEAGREPAEMLSKLNIASSGVLPRTELYPVIEPHRSGHLKVSDLHSLYWEESGNADGEPVVFLHGGPGAGTSGSNRRFFDPEWYRIILFDQRGAGKSTPHACVEENTTWDLVNDIEKIREHLGVEKWKVFGGSWGSTLALTYAQTHPDKVTGIVLRGIFLLRKKEIDWFYQSGCSAIFPDAWESYRDHISEDERDDFLTAYNKRLFSSDVEVQLAAAKAWTNWEMATSYLVPNEDSLKRGENEKFALAFARVENHYFSNKGFFPEDSFILNNMSKIKHIPGVIVQGRYDVVCPMMSAWDLHKAWPEALFKVLCGSLYFMPGERAALDSLIFLKKLLHSRLSLPSFMFLPLKLFAND
ncbi:proline iminopeptidase [Marchantia polymorpha subsp. ruderalis]